MSSEKLEQQKDFEVPEKYRNSLGFINYNQDGKFPWTEKEEIKLSSEYTAERELLALDCEMVRVGHSKTIKALSRVSIVNQFGYCVYDTFVKPSETVTDYPEQFSSIRAVYLIDAPLKDVVVEKVKEIVSEKILVGHSIHHDLKALNLTWHPSIIRDSAIYFEQFYGNKPSLQQLAEKYLGMEIQSGGHNSILDAQLTLKLYLLHKQQWEEWVEELAKRPKQPSLMNIKINKLSLSLNPDMQD